MRRGWGFGGGPRGWGWPGGFAGFATGGRRRQWFGAGDMKYVILELVKDKPRHGYEIMKELEERMHGCYSPSPGTVYPTLQLLEDEGLVKAKEVDGKKVYEITPTASSSSLSTRTWSRTSSTACATLWIRSSEAAWSRSTRAWGVW